MKLWPQAQGSGAESATVELQKSVRVRAGVRRRNLGDWRGWVGLAVFTVGGTGCATSRESESKLAEAPVMEAPVNEAPVEVAPAAVELAVAIRVGRMTEGAVRRIWIVSVDGAGTVVVDRKPIGVTPLLLEVPVSGRGFLAEPITIGVRYVAHNATETSLTSEVELTVTDKPPERIEFQRESARRVYTDAGGLGR